MIKGSKKKSALCLPALMLAIGVTFAIMGVAGFPALLPTGIFYAWIGVRGLRAILDRTAPRHDEPPFSAEHRAWFK